MPIVRGQTAVELARGAVVLDLGDLRSQGDRIIAQARERAAKIIDDAHRERERIVADAATIGRTEGLAEGLAQGHREGVQRGEEAGLNERRENLAKLEASWTEAMEQFTSRRERMLADARRDVLRLAIRIAEKVTKRVVVVDSGVVSAQLDAVLSLVMRPTRLLVTINPQDRELAMAALPSVLARHAGSEHVEFLDDARLGRGSVVVKLVDTADGAGAAAVGGEIDASIDVQLSRIADALLPGRPGDDVVVPAPRNQAADQPGDADDLDNPDEADGADDDGGPNGGNGGGDHGGEPPRSGSSDSTPPSGGVS